MKKINRTRTVTRIIFLGCLLVTMGLLRPALATPYPDRTGFSGSYPTNYGDWQNAFPAGNGEMGIMVFGDPLQDTIIYNDRGFNLPPNADSPLRSFAQVNPEDEATIRSNCAVGNFAAANALAVRSAHYRGGGEGNRHPGYAMAISLAPDGAITNYSRVCDYRTGVVSIHWTDRRGIWTRRSFVSRPDNVIVQSLTAPTDGLLTCTLQLAVNPHMSFPSSMVFTSLVDSASLNLRAQYTGDPHGPGYEGVTRIVRSGGTATVVGNLLTISNAQSVLLLTRIAKYSADCSAHWNEARLQKELAAIPADYQKLLDRQIAVHGAIYDRVKLNLGATAADRARPNEALLEQQAHSPRPVPALWERIFDAGRFYFLCSSSSNTPPDLLGLWTGDCQAGWGGFYHLDANLNLQIAQGNIGAMPEAMTGYFALNEGWQKDFETNAAKLLDCAGMLAAGNSPGTSSGLMASINDYYPYQYATGEEGWLLYPFWEHYLVTGDTNFLRLHLYPLLQDMGRFYESFLTLTDTNGHYIFAGSVSPENQPAHLHVSLVNNSVFDVSGAKFCLSALVETCKILNLEQGPGGGAARWSALLDKLPPYLINRDGALQEWAWPGLEDNFNHRHSSGLLPVWPFREITPETTPAWFTAARATLQQKDKYNYENAGHGLLHAALIAANLKNAQSVNQKLMTLTGQGFYFDSLASAHYDHRHVFCTDTCNAVPAILMEMLVGSSPGVLEFLPALPATLTRGSLSGVKGRNRVTVENLAWDTDAKSVECVLRSDIDQDLTLIERDGISHISGNAPLHASSLGAIAQTVHLRAHRPARLQIQLGELRAVEAALTSGSNSSLALNRPVTVSSQADDTLGIYAVDGQDNTRWSSAYSDNEWIAVDLGTTQKLTGARLAWEAAYGKAYKLQVSNDNAAWTDVYSTDRGAGGIENLTFDGRGRYVRLLGIKRGTNYGYSLWEFSVYGGRETPTAKR